MTNKRCVVVGVLVVVLSLTGTVFLLLQRRPRLYRVTFLPSLGGGSTTPQAINNRGQIAGIARDVTGTRRLFLWDRQTGMRDLGPAYRATCYLNDAGQIAGTTLDPNGTSLAFLWDPNEGQRILGALKGGSSYAYGLNNRGQVVGASDGHAFVWDEDTGMRDLGLHEPGGSVGRAINDAGQVLGIAQRGEQREWWPCRWDVRLKAPGVMLPARYFANRLEVHGDINNDGWVVGASYAAERGEGSVVLWREDVGIKTLFSFGGPMFAPPELNDAKQVLYATSGRRGLSVLSKKLFPPSRRACLWDPNRGNLLLDRYVPHGRGQVFYPIDLNNSGCIVGLVARRDGTGGSRGVLLESIAECWER